MATIFKGQTCLEKNGIEERAIHLSRNCWGKDNMYTKARVDAQFEVQREFPI